MTAPASTPLSSRPAVPWLWLAAVMVTIGLFVAFPPIHVGSKKAVARTESVADAGGFPPVAFVEEFWTRQLQPAAASAPAAGPVLADLRRDPAAAARIHGRRVGLGGDAYFFVRGTGRVAAVESSRLLVEIDGATVAIHTGPVFGNIVRDGCGLLDVNQVPGLAEFNALSAELNHLVEVRVEPALKTGASVGATISFAGCAAAPEMLPAKGPLLTFIPVQAEVKP